MSLLRPFVLMLLFAANTGYSQPFSHFGALSHNSGEHKIYPRFTGTIKTDTFKKWRYYEYDDSIRIYCEATDDTLNALLSSGLLHPFLIYENKPRVGSIEDGLFDSSGKRIILEDMLGKLTKYWIKLYDVKIINSPNRKTLRLELLYNAGYVGIGPRFCVSHIELYNSFCYRKRTFKTFLKKAKVTYYKYISCAA